MLPATVIFVTEAREDMGTTDIREKLHAYIDRADDRLVKMILAMMEAYSESDEEEYELTDAQKEELDKRKEARQQGTSKSYSWEEVKKEARQQLDK